MPVEPLRRAGRASARGRRPSARARRAAVAAGAVELRRRAARRPARRRARPGRRPRWPRSPGSRAAASCAAATSRLLLGEPVGPGRGRAPRPSAQRSVSVGDRAVEPARARRRSAAARSTSGSRARSRGRLVAQLAGEERVGLAARRTTGGPGGGGGARARRRPARRRARCGRRSPGRRAAARPAGRRPAAARSGRQLAPRAAVSAVELGAGPVAPGVPVGERAGGGELGVDLGRRAAAAASAAASAPRPAGRRPRAADSRDPRRRRGARAARRPARAPAPRGRRRRRPGPPGRAACSSRAARIVEPVAGGRPLARPASPRPRRSGRRRTACAAAGRGPRARRAGTGRSRPAAAARPGRTARRREPQPGAQVLRALVDAGADRLPAAVGPALHGELGLLGGPALAALLRAAAARGGG